MLVLKMDNTASSSPQVGLGSADLVVEELVEGGVTRLAAFYYSDLPKEAGPVRSMRASDIGIVSPVDGDMVTSGAAAVTISRISDAGIDFHPEGSPGLYRNSSRYAPYNLFADLSEVAASIKQKARAPQLPAVGRRGRPAEGEPVSTLAASFGGHTTSWAFRKGGYVNDNTYAAEGDRFPADSVLVLSVPVGDAGYTDPSGNSVPETQFEGTGPALLFHDGRLVKGTWRKKALDSVTLKTAEGDKLEVPAGKVWIELLADLGRPHLRALGHRLASSLLCRPLPRRTEAGARCRPRPGPGCQPAGSPRRPRPDARPARGRRGGHDLARGRHGAEEDPGERLEHCLVELPGARAEHRAHDVHDVGERRALLLLAEPLVAQHRGAL